jgi:hypothetical protein
MRCAPYWRERRQRLRDRVGRRNRARLQRDHHGVRGGRREIGGGNAVDLDDRQALAREIDAEVGGAGQVVGDAAKQHGQGQRRRFGSQRVSAGQ